jgi:hypothetical protein
MGTTAHAWKELLVPMMLEEIEVEVEVVPIMSTASRAVDLAAELPQVSQPGYIDRCVYCAVHFFGEKPHIPLRAAADYLQNLEVKYGVPPNLICTRHEFSSPDAGGELAWKTTLVIGDDGIICPR